MVAKACHQVRANHESFVCSDGDYDGAQSKLAELRSNSVRTAAAVW
jgi:hypothetical protein